MAPAGILDSDNLLDRAIEAHYADLKAAVLRRGCARGFVSDVVTISISSLPNSQTF